MIRNFLAIFIALALLSPGCAQSLYNQGKAASDRGDYDTALAHLYEALKLQPDDALAWREIGIAYYKQNLPEKAEEAFGMSNRIKPNALSTLYLGMIFEDRGDLDQAISLYGGALNLPGSGSTKDIIEDRLNVLIDLKLKGEALYAIQHEDSITVETIPENSIAVINFDGTGLPPHLRPLALGLAEFTTLDLSKVSELKVLERVKINVILDELEIGQSSYSDSHIAPRVGRLLGSRRLVLGAVTSTGEESIRIDGALVNTADSTVSRTKATEGRHEKFFDAQKEFVFNLIDTLGIQLSKSERDAIEEVPTESFLAFMAYSEGLYLQKRGMYGDALKSFKTAAEHDPGFSLTTSMANKMEHTAGYFRERMQPGSVRSTDGFEKKITSSLKQGTGGTNLDHIQTVNLINSGFLNNIDTFWNSGTELIPPPGGGLISTGFGIIIIEGNFDAD